MQAQGYLPLGIKIASPWAGASYFIYTDAQNKLFYVYTSITAGTSGVAAAASNIIAGTLPFAYTTKTAGTPPTAGTMCVAADLTCYVVSSVNIPGQNLNNAGGVNYAGLYKHGGCVPVPVCPIDPVTSLPLTAEVVIVPISVSGLNDPDSSAIYPISSFTAYAAAPAAYPVACTGSSTRPTCDAPDIVGKAATTYWRACLQVVTEKGNVQTTNPSSASPGSGSAAAGTDFGANVTLMAITRCPIQMKRQLQIYYI